VNDARVATLQRPAFRYGERSFFLYGAPVRGYGAIVEDYLVSTPPPVYGRRRRDGRPGPA
jgi:hypothetical protein